MAADLSFKNLCFNYPHSNNRPALNCATATLCGPEPVALVGENGAGKSTLCKVLNGVLRPGGGTVTLGGRAVAPFLHPGRYVSYAYQNPNDQLFLDTVWNEIAFGPRHVGMTRDEVDAAVAEALDLFGLKEYSQAHPLDLPFSLRKRVAMASTTSMRRPWVVLDEPTIGQDPLFCDRLGAIIGKIAEQGMGIIIISHDPDFLFEYCPTVLVMTDGKAMWQGSREQFFRGTNRDLGLAQKLPLQFFRASSHPAW